MRYSFMKRIGMLIVCGLIVAYIYNVMYIVKERDVLTQNIISEITKTDIIKDMQEGKLTLVIDAGHGGMDPGKVGINGVLEKDINLKIATKLRDKLIGSGINVVMTRESDDGLYSDSDSGKKMADLKKRVDIINNSDAALLVSIHQNSFTSEDVTGAQVLYYSNSDLSKEIAKFVQDNMVAKLQDNKPRVEKENGSYYILKKTQIPAIIVECGFLSNYDEAERLASEEHQNEVVDAISEGIILWFNSLIEGEAPVIAVCDAEARETKLVDR